MVLKKTTQNATSFFHLGHSYTYVSKAKLSSLSGLRGCNYYWIIGVVLGGLRNEDNVGSLRGETSGY